jgi:Nucleotidyl transferase AbiEii toxin, Type IV TA system
MVWSFVARRFEFGEIREDNAYGGMRVTLEARLGKIRIPLQVDIGFGDAVTPEAQREEFPTLLDFMMPPSIAAAEGKAFLLRWTPGGPWQVR